MSFTVKATYHSETRKIAFTESPFFPTYEKLTYQLTRVFPIHRPNFRLTKLYFSSDSSPRALISVAVDSNTEYQNSIAPYRGRFHPNALLRIHVEDKFPLSFRNIAYETWQRNDAPRSRPPPDLFVSPSFIPPPPIIFPSSYTQPSHVKEDAQHLKDRPYSNDVQTAHAQSHAQLSQQHDKRTPCCPVSEAKAEFERLLATFKQDLDRLFKNTLGSSTSAVDSTRPSMSHPTGDINFERDFGQWFAADGNVLGTPPRRAPIAPRMSTAQGIPVSTSPQAARPTQSSMPPLTTPSTPPLPIHEGVICDVCDEVIVGVRHKCLDCPDYDLCMTCLEAGGAERHNGFHQFFDIEEPGRVIVHTVFSGDGERNAREPLRPHNGQRASNNEPMSPQPVRHRASCDLCDSVIIGVRYKCLNCPDFDTCSSCFTVRQELHPEHGFVKVINLEDLLMRKASTQIPHRAHCDSCQKTIVGDRYKCMHPDCPDFDLCANCEALPIPVHPSTHPMLKVKTPNTMIPTVQRTAILPTATAAQALRPRLFGSSSTADTKESDPVMLAPKLARYGDSLDTRSRLSPACKDFLCTRQSSPPIPSRLPISSRNTSLAIATKEPSLCSYQASRPESPMLNLTDRHLSQSPPAIHVVPSLTARELWRNFDDQAVGYDSDASLRLDCDVRTWVNRPQPIEIKTPVSHTPPRTLTPPTPVLIPPPVPTSCQIDCITPASPESYGRSTPEVGTPSPADSSPASLAINPDLLNYPSIFKSLVGTPSNPDGHSSAQPAPLSAVSVSTGVPSQVFPPGAEFVKTFRIKNDGDRPWPEATTLMFVLGEPFFDSSDERGKVAVGAVSAGATVDVWTGELKAPEAPGWYLGYWRLADGESNFFGDTLWIDIAVVEMSKLSDAPIDAPESLASSSVIMPISAPSHGTAPSDTSGVEAGDSPVTALSKLSTEDDMDSDFDSDSVSLVSAPSARSDRGIIGLARGGYVVIDGSSGEE